MFPPKSEDCRNGHWCWGRALPDPPLPLAPAKSRGSVCQIVWKLREAERDYGKAPLPFFEISKHNSDSGTKGQRRILLEHLWLGAW